MAIFFKRLSLVFFILLSQFQFFIFSQDANSIISQKKQVNGYGDYQFGLSLESVKKLLANDQQFFYQGDPDVTLLEPDDRTTVSVMGRDSLLNAFFVFDQNLLYTIILEVNERFIDHFLLYNQLFLKYGEPSNLSPQKVQWELGKNIVMLERPLIIKYIDGSILEKISNRLKTQDKTSSQILKNLLEQL